MARERSKAADEAWEFVEREKRIDRFIRRVSFGAWAVTVVIVLAFAFMTALQVFEMIQAVRQEQLPWAVVVGSRDPLVRRIGRAGCPDRNPEHGRHVPASANLEPR